MIMLQKRGMAPCTHPVHALRLLFGAQDYITGDSFRVVFCSQCHCHVTIPVPEAGALDRYYPDTYYGPIAGGRFPFIVECFLRSLYAHRAWMVEQMNNGQKGVILDIGCGRGQLLHAFLVRGWKVMGTEMSERSAAHARERLGIPVQIGELASLHFPENHFDVVVLWHVLEHVRDPHGFLTETQRILRPGGVLVVGVPNFGSLEARISREKWFPLDVPRHLTHWTPDTLDAVLVKAGFHTVQHSFFAAEYDFFSIVQSALNLLGFRKNLLYNFLRRRGAKVLPGTKAGVVEGMLCLVLAIPLSMLSVPATLFLSLMRSGASMTMLARKM